MTREEAIKLLVLLIRAGSIFQESETEDGVTQDLILRRGFEALVALGVWEHQVYEAVQQILKEADEL